MMRRDVDAETVVGSNTAPRTLTRKADQKEENEAVKESVSPDSGTRKSREMGSLVCDGSRSVCS